MKGHQPGTAQRAVRRSHLPLLSDMLLERGTVSLNTPATCAGCGCTDAQACAQGCSWLAVNRATRSGVCSSCAGALPAWRNQQSRDNHG